MPSPTIYYGTPTFLFLLGWTEAINGDLRLARSRPASNLERRVGIRRW